MSSVDVVSQKQVVRLWREVTDLEDSQQVDVLTVDVSSDDQRRIQLDQVWLADENLLRLFNQHFDLLLSQIDWLYPEIWSVWVDVLSYFK